MLPDRVSNPGPLTYESGALPIALRSPAILLGMNDTTQKKLLDNELPVHVKKITFLTNSAIGERIIDVHE